MAKLGWRLVPVPVLLVGLIGVYHVTQSPQFPMYRSVDVLQLVASGMCFGVALAAIVRGLRSKPTA